MNKNNRPKIIVISGPSGVGKHTIIEKLMANTELNLSYSISMTSRSPRENEVNGIDYYFVSKEEFENNIKEDKFVEYAVFCNNYYGTLKSEIDRLNNLNKNVILEIEVQGALQVIEKLKDKNLLSIFICPPSIEELERRLYNRNTETKDQIDNRIKTAISELTYMSHYKYHVVNDDINECILNIENLIKN